MSAFGQQIAALPMRRDKNGDLKVLMVTSRGSGRWIMPKGWRMEGRKNWEAAKIEALEEAGAVGFVSEDRIGEYRYEKVLEDGTALPCEVRVYPMWVEKLKKRWKEGDERKRRWFAPKDAAKRVDEPELAALLRSLADKRFRASKIKGLKRAS